MKSKRIHILGGVGSGKTYLGRKLAQLLKIPHFNLDKIHYGNPDKEKRAKEFNRIISKKEWIIEGHWYDWAKKSFAKSDKIILLEVNLFTRDLNLFKRLIKRTFGLEEGRKLNLKNFLDMIKLNHQWDEAKAKSTIKKYKAKTLIFSKADKALEFIKSN